MRTHLRLHRDDETDAGRPEGAESGSVACVYRFPADRARTRERLVAGAVERAAVPEPPLAFPGGASPVAGGDVIGRTFSVGAGPLADLDGGDATTSDRLLHEIEVTLDRMQGRLNRVKRQVDEVFKFPVPPRDDGPRAA